MNAQLVALVAVLGFSVSACASSAPRSVASANEVRMYTNAEWSEMNSTSSIPEIPADAIASADVAPTQTSYAARSGFGSLDSFGSTIGGARFSFGGVFGQGFASSNAFANTSFGRRSVFTGQSAGGGGAFGAHGFGSFGHASSSGHASSGHASGGHSSGGHGGGHGGR